jgi:hypothetical protein
MVLTKENVALAASIYDILYWGQYTNQKSIFLRTDYSNLLHWLDIIPGSPIGARLTPMFRLLFCMMVRDFAESKIFIGHFV